MRTLAFDSAFDDANVESKKFTQSGKVRVRRTRITPARLGEGAGLFTFRLKMGLQFLLDIYLYKRCLANKGANYNASPYIVPPDSMDGGGDASFPG